MINVENDYVRGKNDCINGTYKEGQSLSYERGYKKADEEETRRYERNQLAEAFGLKELMGYE